MVEQKDSKAIRIITALGLFAVFCLLCFNDNLSKVGDSIFLYNRCLQMRECLRHGYYPFFYYEDLGGIGYGTPIFYGQLTLFPFIPFVDDISSFLHVYFLACLLLNFFGFRCFVKRFSPNATLMSCFYIFSMPFISLYGWNLPANVMAAGFSWFFFAYCVDFFRDRRGFAYLILAYFMIWQSNFNATVLATLVCFCIFCFYFKRERLLDYVRLFIAVLLLVSFNLVNMYIHRDAIALMTPEDMLKIVDSDADARVMSIHPLGGYVFRLFCFSVDRHCGFTTFIAFGVFAYYMVRYFGSQTKRYKIASIAVLTVSVVGYVIGISSIWPTVYKATNLFFQFPLRYWIILYGMILTVLSRVVKQNRIVCLVAVFVILDILFVNPLRTNPSTGRYYIAWQLSNGEYASSSFVKDWDTYVQYSENVNSESGAVYEFTRDFNIVEVDCSVNPGGDVVTLPKLYYNGYEAVGDNGEVFSVESGYSNYCKVDLGDYTGTLHLSYCVPKITIAFCCLQIASLLSCLWLVAFKHGQPDWGSRKGGAGFASAR